MTHLGWFKGRGELDASGDGLSPDRLADMLDVMRSAPPEEPPTLYESPAQASSVEKARPPVALATKRHLAKRHLAKGHLAKRHPPQRQLAQRQPAQRQLAQRHLVVVGAVAPAANMPAVAAPSVWDIGRHRSPTSQKLAIRGISFASRRSALMGALTLLVVSSALLLALS